MSHGYIRRQELVCTLDELATYSSVILRMNEILYVKQADGTYNIKMGDGITPVGELPYVMSSGGSSEDTEARERIQDLTDIVQEIDDHVAQHCNDISNIYNVISAFHTWTLYHSAEAVIEIDPDDDATATAVVEFSESIAAITQRGNAVIKIVASIVGYDGDNYYVHAEYIARGDAGEYYIPAEGYGTSATLLAIPHQTGYENMGYSFMAGGPEIAQTGARLRVEIYTKEL